MTTTVHVFQWVALFAAAIGVTATWLLSRPESRWRHILGGIIATTLWIPLAAFSNNVGVASNGSTLTFGSDALVTLSLFMIVVCIAGLVVGLFLWVEQAVDDAGEAMPPEAQDRRGGRP